MVRHGIAPCGPWLVNASAFGAGRAGTLITSEDYITGKLWERATIRCCPWHPSGSCGFSRHGTYARVKPANIRVARWYCPKEKRTVSALPDCLASHRSGTLDECEAMVCTVENSISIQTACRDLRTEIELPGVLRYVARLIRDIYRALKAIKGLFPLRFTGEPSVNGFSQQLDTKTVLRDLRSMVSKFLPQLPTPIGFNPSCDSTHTIKHSFQHRVGRDPPVALIEATG